MHQYTHLPVCIHPSNKFPIVKLWLHGYGGSDMKDPLAQFASLLKSLSAEKAALQARLEAINAVLGGVTAPTALARGTGRGKRSFSAATKAKMAAAQRAGRATSKRQKAAPAKGWKRKFSPAARAKMAAAAKARWAKAKAAGQKTLKK